MRIAVFADLHGNPYACRALLQAIADQGPCDAIVAAGDLCLGGSDPAACVDLLQKANVLGVYGNADRYLLAPDQAPPDRSHRRRWHWIQPAAYWTLEQLSPGQLAWLGALPFERRFSPTGSPQDDLLVVHANPRDVELMIYPPEEEQKRLWGEVRQADLAPALAKVLEGVTAQVIAFGHFHYVFQRQWRDLRLVDVGSCSLPGYDHDPRAKYALINWQEEGLQEGNWRIEHHWVEYDANQEIAALQASDMPSRDEFLRFFG